MLSSQVFEVEQADADSTLRFAVRQCAEPLVPEEGILATRPSLRKRQRKEQHKKSQRPRDWRTRKDPFEGCWEQVTSWRSANPERTGVSIFQELQQFYPGRWRLTQQRTDTSRCSETPAPSPGDL